MLPEDVFHKPAELRQWIARAFEFAATLPQEDQGSSQEAATKKPANDTRWPSAVRSPGRLVSEIRS